MHLFYATIVQLVVTCPVCRQFGEQIFENIDYKICFIAVIVDVWPVAFLSLLLLTDNVSVICD
jgi:hypothetical protein